MTSPQFDKVLGLLDERRQWGSAPPVEVMRAAMEATAFPPGEDVEVRPVEPGGPPGEWVVSRGSLRASERQSSVASSAVGGHGAVLYLHGGGYALGSPVTHRKLAGDVSRAAGVPCLLVDYRRAPEHVHPAAFDDAVAAYRWLLDRVGDPAAVALGGDSAGGGLVVAALVALRDAGERLPAAAVCISPWVDLDRCFLADRDDHLDPVLTGGDLERFRDWYVPNGDRRRPTASPVFADLHGLPPLLVHAGGAEVLLDDAIALDRAASAAGVDVTLEIWPDMVHVWHVFAGRVPESTAAMARVGEFLRGHLAV